MNIIFLSISLIFSCMIMKGMEQDTVKKVPIIPSLEEFFNECDVYDDEDDTDMVSQEKPLSVSCEEVNMEAPFHEDRSFIEALRYTLQEIKNHNLFSYQKGEQVCAQQCLERLLTRKIMPFHPLRKELMKSVKVPIYDYDHSSDQSIGDHIGWMQYDIYDRSWNGRISISFFNQKLYECDCPLVMREPPLLACASRNHTWPTMALFSYFDKKNKKKKHALVDGEAFQEIRAYFFKGTPFQIIPILDQVAQALKANRYLKKRKKLLLLQRHYVLLQQELPPLLWHLIKPYIKT